MPLPDKTLAELQAEYKEATERLEWATRVATLALQEYKAAQYQTVVARQAVHDKERELTNSLHFV